MVPVTVVDLTPRRCAHPEASVDGTLMASVAKPGNEMLVTLFVTVVGLRATPLVPTRRVDHLMFPETGASVEESVRHARGGRTKVPVKAPWVRARCKTCATSSVVQPDSEARIEDRVVPPPDLVSDGEKLSLAENEHCTDPEASVRANAGEDVMVSKATPIERAIAKR
jgi:hypothetical protein